MQSAAIIVAAGDGKRAGGNVPKQARHLLGRPLVEWCVAAFLAHPDIEQVILVTTEALKAEFALYDWAQNVTFALGGSTRTQSVQAGLRAVTLVGDVNVLIHDAARPGIDRTVIDALLSALKTAKAAVPALPIADAIKRDIDGHMETVDRNDLYRVQTPQAFHLDTIRAALGEAPADLVDDLAALDPLGIEVARVPGSDRYGKVTFPEDFEAMSALLSPPKAPRIGKGFDVHAFEPGSHVTLCGINIPHTAQLKGHSDADAGWHALTDAILGAAALGDIGDHFPPSDSKWKDADSAVFLEAAVTLAREAGFQLTSCDITIICEAPKVKPYRLEMRQRAADVTGLDLSAISVKATTTETLGFTGRKEGIAAEAVAVLMPL